MMTSSKDLSKQELIARRNSTQAKLNAPWFLAIEEGGPECIINAIEQHRAILVEIEDERKELVALHMSAPDSEDWFYEILFEDIDKKRETIVTGIKKLKRYGGNRPRGFNVADIKLIPISDIIGRAPRESKYRDNYLCPIHNEKTPSFVVYKYENRWHCFGCSEGGDVIDLVMKINNLDFVSACRSLSPN
jgi:hypothetical protein